MPQPEIPQNDPRQPSSGWREIHNQDGPATLSCSIPKLGADLSATLDDDGLVERMELKFHHADKKRIEKYGYQVLGAYWSLEILIPGIDLHITNKDHAHHITAALDFSGQSAQREDPLVIFLQNVHMTPFTDVEPTPALVAARYLRPESRDRLYPALSKDSVIPVHCVTPLLKQINSEDPVLLEALLRYTTSLPAEAAPDFRHRLLTIMMTTVSEAEFDKNLGIIASCAPAFFNHPGPLPSLFVDVFLDRLDPPADPEKVHETSHSFLSELLPHVLRCLPLAERSIRVETLAERYITASQTSLFLSLLSNALGRGRNNQFAHFEGFLPDFEEGENRQASIQLKLPISLGEKIYGRIMGRDLARFCGILGAFEPGLAPRVVHELRQFQPEALAKYLGSFTGLDATLAADLVQKGHGRRVVAHLGSFTLSPPERLKIVNSALARQADREDVFGALYDLEDKLVAPIERGLHLLEFRREIGLPDRAIFEKFRDAKEHSDVVTIETLTDSVNKLKRALISSEPWDPQLTQSHYFAPVVAGIFPAHGAPNHVLSRGAFNAPDRSDDIKQFDFDPRYDMTIGDAILLERRSKTPLPEKAVNAAVRPLQEALNVLMPRADSTENLQRELHEHLNKLAKIPSWAVSPGEKLLIALGEYACGRISETEAKKVVSLHYFVHVHGLAEYVRGTQNRVEKAKNQEYATLATYHELFADTLQELIYQLIERAAGNEMLLAHLRKMQSDYSDHAFEQRLQNLKHKYKGELPGTGAFFARTLATKSQQLLRSSSREAGGFAEEVSRQISEKTEAVADIITATVGSRVAPEEIHLDCESFESIRERWDVAKQAAHFPALEAIRLKKFLGALFQEEARLLSDQIRCYRPKDNHDRQVRRLEAFFTKNAPSSLARAVAGVCVQMDNKTQTSHADDDGWTTVKLSQWDLPNYFQLVFRDPDNSRCEGLVLLHHYIVNGHKVLTASFNPSSTFLFKVDEHAMFEKIMEVLEDFAERNTFGYITCSTNGTIRTNRGGEFRRALEERIRQCKERISLPRPMPFSLSPTYSQQDLDVLWRSKRIK